MKKLITLLLVLSCIFTIAPIHDINASTYSTSDFTELKMYTEVNSDELLLFLDNKDQLHMICYAAHDYADGHYLLGFAYAADTTNKANYIDIVSYKQKNSTSVTPNTNTTFNTKDMTIASLIYDINKSELNQKYLYLTIGVYSNTNADTYDDSIDIKIKNPFYMTSLKADTTNIYLKKGATHQISLTSTPANAYKGTLTYTSSSKDVASVSSTGKITALDAGTTTITIKSSTGKTVKCNVYVNTDTFPFYDVNPGTWYRKTIEEVYQLGLLTGANDTLFKPNANMNRAMVAIVFHRMEGSRKVPYSNQFSDVKDNQYYTTSVLWAKQSGVINGYKDGTFKPTKNVTREEMATMICNFAKYKGLNVKASKDITGYNDYHKITAYARAPMQWAVEKGLMSGKDNGTRLDPLGNATRAECSKMLLQAYKLIYK